MGLIDDMAEIDAIAFSDTDTFGESITYKPFGGTNRTVAGVVVRSVDQSPNSPRVRMIIRITVANDSTTGISINDIDFSRDRVSVPTHKGGTAVDRAIVPDIKKQDAGMITLELV